MRDGVRVACEKVGYAGGHAPHSARGRAHTCPRCAHTLLAEQEGGRHLPGSGPPLHGAWHGMGEGRCPPPRFATRPRVPHSPHSRGPFARAWGQGERVRGSPTHKRREGLPCRLHAGSRPRSPSYRTPQCPWGLCTDGVQKRGRTRRPLLTCLSRSMPVWAPSSWSHPPNRGGRARVPLIRGAPCFARTGQGRGWKWGRHLLRTPFTGQGGDSRGDC
jgi:hypothetical protein